MTVQSLRASQLCSQCHMQFFWSPEKISKKTLGSRLAVSSSLKLCLDLVISFPETPPYDCIRPNLNYCSSVWQFWGARNAEKLDILNKDFLRFLLIKDYNFPYGNLLDKINLNPLYIRCLQIFLVIPLYGPLFNNYLPT